MKYINRNIQNKIDKFLFDDDIIILTGARQTGKSSLLKYYVDSLKSKNFDTAYISLEDIDYLNILNASPKNLLQFVSLSKKKVYVFIDEIQYLNNPTNFLKYIYDEYKDKIKLFVFGSSAFYIDSKFTDSLAGRKKIFILNTLSFSEFLRFKNENKLKQIYDTIDLNKKDLSIYNIIDQKKIEILKNEYMQYGGYPRVVLENDFEKKILLIQELANSYVKKDALESNINYIDKFYMLFQLLANNIGNLVNKNELSKILNVSTTVIDNYLTIIKKSFHIYMVEPFYNNLPKEIRKMKKIYFNDLGLRNFFVKNFNVINSRNDKGELYENFVYKQLIELYNSDSVKFWHTQSQNEVDFIVDNKYAYEVKCNENLFQYSKYKSFLEKYPKIKFYLISQTTPTNKFKKTNFLKF